MEMTYTLIFVLCNIVNTYVLYKYFNDLFCHEKYSQYIECFSYIVFFIANTLLYFLIGIPIVILSVNLISYYLLSLNYKGRQKQKIFAAILFCLMLMLIESVIVLITTTTTIDLFDQNPYYDIVGQVFISIFAYLFVEILGQRWSIDNRLKLPFSYWFFLLITPVCSLFIVLYLLSFNRMGEWEIAVFCIILLFINLSIFYLYDKVTAYFSGEVNNAILTQQIKYYDHLIKSIKISSEKTHRLQHDLKNHFIAMESLLNAGEFEQLRRYLSSSFQDALSGDALIDSGNTVIDGLLNYKIQESAEKELEFLVDLKIPQGLMIDNESLTMLLGNLIDNAIEATTQVTGERKISLRMLYEKQNIFIVISNPFKGRIERNNRRFITSKKDKEGHGYGLNTVQQIVKENGGIINIDYDNQKFTVTVVLYVA